MRNSKQSAGRRRMTTAELATWRSLLDTTAELRKLLGTQLSQETTLSPADYQVLLALTEADDKRMRSSELAASIDWERSRLSHHLGRMEKRGLIRRDDCATDNRGAEVCLTDEGTRTFRAATAPHMRAIQQYFTDALTPEQFEALDDILRSLRRHLHPQSLTNPTGGEQS